jgi:hypothetical protein
LPARSISGQSRRVRRSNFVGGRREDRHDLSTADVVFISVIVLSFLLLGAGVFVGFGFATACTDVPSNGGVGQAPCNRVGLAIKLNTVLQQRSSSSLGLEAVGHVHVHGWRGRFWWLLSSCSSCRSRSRIHTDELRAFARPTVGDGPRQICRSSLLVVPRMMRSWHRGLTSLARGRTVEAGFPARSMPPRTTYSRRRKKRTSLPIAKAKSYWRRAAES